MKINELNDIYNDWRKVIDKIAGMKLENPLEYAPMLTEARNLGYAFYRKTGKCISLHEVT